MIFLKRGMVQTGSGPLPVLQYDNEGEGLYLYSTRLSRGARTAGSLKEESRFLLFKKGEDGELIPVPLPSVQGEIALEEGHVAYHATYINEMISTANLVEITSDWRVSDWVKRRIFTEGLTPEYWGPHPSK